MTMTDDHTKYQKLHYCQLYQVQETDPQRQLIQDLIISFFTRSKAAELLLK